MKKVRNVVKRIAFGILGILGLALIGAIIYGISWLLGRLFKGASWLFNWIYGRFPLLIEVLKKIKLDPASVAVGILLVIAFMVISSITMWIWKKIKMRKAGGKKHKKIRLMRRKSDEDEEEQEEVSRNLENAV